MSLLLSGVAGAGVARGCRRRALQTPCRASAPGLTGFRCGAVGHARRDRAQGAIIRTQMEAIGAARARLVQSEKLAALGQLSATIAHEVRNPLAVIRSAAQSLGETVAAGDAEGERACRFITAEIDRL